MSVKFIHNLENKTIDMKVITAMLKNKKQNQVREKVVIENRILRIFLFKPPEGNVCSQANELIYDISRSATYIQYIYLYNVYFKCFSPKNLLQGNEFS